MSENKPSITLDLYTYWGQLEKAGKTVIRGIVLRPGVYYFIYKDNTYYKERLIDQGKIVFDRIMDRRKITLYVDLKLPVTYEDIAGY